MAEPAAMPDQSRPRPHEIPDDPPVRAHRSLQHSADGNGVAAHLQRSKVLIASPDPSLLELLRSQLDRAFVVVTGGEDFPTLCQDVSRHLPDLTLLDAALPGGSARATSFIASNNLGQVVLILTNPEPFDGLMRALRAGASGYITGIQTAERLTAIVLGVLDGEAALPRSAVGKLLAEFRARPRSVVELPNQQRVRLTQREREVVQLLRTGLDTGQISRLLGVADVTVRTHISTLKRKLHVANRTELLTIRLPGLGGTAITPVPHPRNPDRTSGDQSLR